MRLPICLTLMVLAAGCTTTGPTIPADADALCAGLAPLARRHAADLAYDGGDRAVVSGALLLRGLDAGCGGPE